MNDKHVLDPLWITLGSSGLDSEYSKYVLLDANQKYRKLLEEGDISSFYEIMFHALNLTNLAVDGSMFKFNLTPVWDDSKLVEIRDYLKTIYQLPPDIMSIFKNANYLLVGLLLDYLDAMLDITDDTKVHFRNGGIHREKEIFIVINSENDLNYDIWKLKLDKRFKFGHKVTHVQNVVLDEIREDALKDAVIEINNPDMANIDADKNIIFCMVKKKGDNEKIASVISASLIFSRGITKDIRFEPNILEELYVLLNAERVLPFTIKSWI